MSRWRQLCISGISSPGEPEDRPEKRHHLITILEQQQNGLGINTTGPNLNLKRLKTRTLSPRLCLTAVVTVAFVVGIVIGILLPISTGSSSLSSPPLLLPLLSAYDKKSGEMLEGPVTPSAPSVTPLLSAFSFLHQKAFDNTNRSSSTSPSFDSQSDQRTKERDDDILRTFGDVMVKYRWWPLTSESEISSRAKQRTLKTTTTTANGASKQRETLNLESETVDNAVKQRQIVSESALLSRFTDDTVAVEDGETRQMVRPTVDGHRRNGLRDNMNVASLVSDGVYWSDLVEEALPVGFEDDDSAQWTSFTESQPVVKVLEGCGRMQNRLLVFENGTKACCRYRQNNDQIQGEIFSFYLAHLLGLRNLPPATLGLLYGREWQWRSVRGQLTLAQWNEQKPVVMTKFVEDLTPAYIPKHLRGVIGKEGDEEERRLHPLADDLGGLSREQITELAQWSDLVIFDYLTANLDRVVNNMYNKQWNPDMMDAPAHNLAKVSSTGLLVFLDNESGLLHGYRLLDKYESYHRATLRALCVFRRSTVQAVRDLRGVNDAAEVGKRLKEILKSRQPKMMDWLPLLPEKSVKVLRERLARVEEQVRLCENSYVIDDVETLTKPTLLELNVTHTA